MVIFKEANYTKHTCPVSDIVYNGICQVFTCPANMINLSKSLHAGCVHEHLTEITFESLGKLLKVDPSTIKKRYSKGLTALNYFVEFYDEVRSVEMKRKYPYECGMCGIGKLYPKDCLNTLACSNRLTFMRKHIANYPFHVGKFQATPNIFWEIIADSRNDKFIGNKIAQEGRSLIELVPR